MHLSVFLTNVSDDVLVGLGCFFFHSLSTFGTMKPLGGIPSCK